MVKAVDGVDFEVRRAELFGLVGESGRGKTVTTLSISRLIDELGKMIGGSMTFYSNSLYDISEHDMVDQCDSWITMVFQQPVSSLNPVFTVGGQVAEVLKVHKRMEDGAA